MTPAAPAASVATVELILLRADLVDLLRRLPNPDADRAIDFIADAMLLGGFTRDNLAELRRYDGSPDTPWGVDLYRAARDHIVTAVQLADTGHQQPRNRRRRRR